jgi:sulfate adenylyltransferase
MPASPHGGRLIDRQAEGAGGAKLAAEAVRMPSITLNDREQCDLEMIGNGAMSPLEGFMGRSEYESVLRDMRLPSGPVWSLPVTLSLKADSPAVSAGDEVALVDQSGRVRGTMEVGEVFEADLEAEASSSLGTCDPAHPGVAYLRMLTGRYAAGRITSIRDRSTEPFAERRLDPRETRVLFKTMGWNTIAAFQTRNPVHRAHEYIQKCALETVDGLMLHPLVGMTKDDDIPADTRMRCYEVLLDNYFPRGRVVMSVFPAAMRYAGPKEAVFHALLRKNYGCTHFIVGRDHAGVGNYYGTYDAQIIFDGFDQADLGVVPLKFEHAFFCRKCGGMASPKTCPHGDPDHVTLSGRRVREMLAAGEIPPGEFTRDEVARVLVEWAAGRGESR